MNAKKNKNKTETFSKDLNHEINTQNQQISNSDLENVSGGKVEYGSFEDHEETDHYYSSTLNDPDGKKFYWVSELGHDEAERRAKERDAQLAKMKCNKK